MIDHLLTLRQFSFMSAVPFQRVFIDEDTDVNMRNQFQWFMPMAPSARLLGANVYVDTIKSRIYTHVFKKCHEVVNAANHTRLMPQMFEIGTTVRAITQDQLQ